MKFTLTQVLYVVGIVTLIVAGAIASVLWFRQKQQEKKALKAELPGPEKRAEAAPDTAQIDSLFRNAQKILGNSPKMKGASAATLPVFLVVGPAGAGRTSVIERSGMDRKLLAGQVHLDSDIAPTKTLNIWLARETLFVEVAEPVVRDAASLGAILRQLMPGGVAALSGKTQRPRGIILCVDQATVASAKTGDDLTALARPWNECLEQMAGVLGVQLPVYVLFTRLDTLPGFPEFISNLHAKDLNQTIGSTLRPFNPAAGAVYGEEMAQVLNLEFSGLCSTLCDSRVPVMNRQNDGARLPLEYQFARNFQKLQKNIVSFLIELARPSQLHVSPFLRGFYFSGTRKTLVDSTDARDLPARPAQPAPAYGATSVINLEQLRAQSAQAPAAPEAPRSREVTEWPFLPALLDGVILRDESAHGASATSSRTDRFRAMAWAFVSLMGLLLLIALTVSFIRNRRIEKELISGAQALSQPVVKAEELNRLERMRLPLERLVQLHDSHPLSMSWGLYSGDKLLEPARAVYCSAFRAQVLPPVLQQITTHLRSLRNAGGQASDVWLLKAYMMMTTHPQKADASFLGQQLLDVWNETPGHSTEPESARLMSAQFRMYGALLPLAGEENSCISSAAPELVADSQSYLRSLNANDRYQSLLQQAGSGLNPVNYAVLFPNDAVSDPKVVPGWFTRQGWTRMQQLLEHPEDSLKADAWVLGESKDLSPQELAMIATEYRGRYVADYVRTWKEFLGAARVLPYANLTDAAAKLEKISGDRSFLLSLIGLVTEHTAAIDKVNILFQPTKAVVPKPGEFQPGAEYLKQLDLLKNRLSKAAQSTGPAHDQDAQEVRNTATNAQDSVDQIARAPGFRGETDQLVKSILLMPITQIGPLLNKQTADAANGSGADLCRAYNQLSKSLPFSAKAQQSASLDDVQRVFQPERGQMWLFYNDWLKDSLDCLGANCSVKSSPKFNLSAGFVEFFRSLNHWSRLLYGGNPDPVIRLQIRAASLNHLRQLDLILDDQKSVFQAGASEFQTVTWDLRRAQKLLVIGTFDGEPQPQELFRTEGHWALFEWFYNAEPGSGGTDGFNWLPRNGTIKAATLNNGNTKKYKLDIRQADGSTTPLDLRQLNSASCASPVTR